ncbi:exodeoxyribonuclease VII large subunit [Marinobacterium arenosum]|uniref:exodeoxyribonuclease VII large subunit n=1 Tax=Marinobacterium arenosum TaxID=2862496 RepID=UPI001C96ED4A|nr:exodeoxyribonuclease VII large subunit [Marinobacterium arenosum]MBY4678520.1 exodeoxyribonuclease VII large subunit [Marinobacterium arenosum]
MTTRTHFDRPASSHALSVSELNRQVRSLLERSFLTIEVQGELSNFVRPSSGHWYFTLKDANAQVRCAMFRNRNQLLRYRPKDGDQVVVRAKVSLYEGRGDYQLICEHMTESGVGLLQQAFEQLKAQLQQEGLFDPAHKKPLPTYASHIGVVTSPTGAAIHDILTVLKRRFPGLPVTLYPTAVQGEEAPAQICRAIELANRHGECDVLIVGRGGGSLEDLWPFNDERVARAIHASELPIVSAVGHEVDLSISDFVADVRAATPSAAAELLSPDQTALRSQLYQLQVRLSRQLKQRLQQRRERLLALRARLRHPGERLRQRAQRLDDLELRLRRSLQRRLEQRQLKLASLDKRLSLCAPQRQIQLKRQQVEQLSHQLQQQLQQQLQARQLRLRATAGQLHTVSPLATLERGYAIVQTGAGRVVRDASEASVGMQLESRLHRGRLRSTVTEILTEKE